MITTMKPVRVKRKYRHSDWRPSFAILRRIAFSLPGAPNDVNGDPARVGCWVFMEWIETKSRDDDNRWPWLYRLRPPE